MPWNLKRTHQCKKCPWIKGVDPHDIPGGYCETKHANLASTIARPGELNLGTLSVMACHESPVGDEAHCVGWLVNQAGPGNNIGLRLSLMSCGNSGEIRLRGDQHERFEDTLP